MSSNLLIYYSLIIDTHADIYARNLYTQAIPPVPHAPATRVAAREPEPSRPEPEIATRAIEHNIVWRAISQMHVAMPAHLEMEYVLSMRRACNHFTESGGMPTWSLFAGTGLSSKLIVIVQDFFKTRYNIDLASHVAVLSEKNKQKLKFLQAQHPDAVVFSDNVNDLAMSAVTNCRIWREGEHTRRAVLPRCSFMDCGTPCQARTPASNSSSNNVNCVQQQRETTGLGWKAASEAISAHKPLVGQIECVKELQALDLKTSPISDAQYIVNDMVKKGYWCTFSELDTTDYGHCQDRVRLWWPFCSCRPHKHAAATSWYSNILSSFKVVPWTFKAEDFLDHEKEVRKATAERLGLPLWSDIGIRKSQKDKDWAVEHMRLAQANGLSWPFNVETFASTTSLCFDGLRERECEVLCFVDKWWPPRTDANAPTLESFDINPGTMRVLKQHIDEWTLQVKPAETRSQTTSWGPWRRDLCTQIGSGKIVVRFQTDTGHAARLVEAYESMRLIGWSDESWEADGLLGYDQKLERMDLIVNMVGNAFCWAHWVPVFCATMSTFGKFGTFLSRGDSCVPTLNDADDDASDDLGRCVGDGFNHTGFSSTL